MSTPTQPVTAIVASHDGHANGYPNESIRVTGPDDQVEASDSELARRAESAASEAD